MTTDSAEIFSGTCLCENVGFTVKAPTLWCAHCHCSMCRRAHGAAFVTWVGVASDRVEITGDTAKWHTSSPGARRGFCSDCGSTLFFESEKWPGETHIVLGNFNSPIDRSPSGNAFFEDHVDWYEIPP